MNFCRTFIPCILLLLQLAGANSAQAEAAKSFPDPIALIIFVRHNCTRHVILQKSAIFTFSRFHSAWVRCPIKILMLTLTCTGSPCLMPLKSVQTSLIVQMLNWLSSRKFFWGWQKRIGDCFLNNRLFSLLFFLFVFWRGQKSFRGGLPLPPLAESQHRT